jgi:hypothetical protein
MLIFFTPRVRADVEGDVEVASPTIASESAEVSWSYDDDAEEEEDEKAEVEAHPDADSEADLGILDPVLGEGDAAAPADDDDPRTAERHDEDADDESSRGGTRGPADGRQRLGGARRSAGDGSANHNHNHNTPYTLWSQISLAARRVGSRRFMLASASGTSWHLGSSNFFVGPRDEDEDEDEDDTVPERGTGSGRAGARSWPRGGSVVHGCEWMLRCVGLYGV